MNVEERPLPKIGAKIKCDYGQNNINTWKLWGKVRGIVDGHVVVSRWWPHKRYHHYQIINPTEWSMLPYVVKERKP